MTARSLIFRILIPPSVSPSFRKKTAPFRPSSIAVRTFLLTRTPVSLNGGGAHTALALRCAESSPLLRSGKRKGSRTSLAKTYSGETAPLLFTALFSNYWLVQDGTPALMGPTASLAVLIYNFAGMPFDNQIEMAWTAALILVLLVLVINITGQVLSRRKV